MLRRNGTMLRRQATGDMENARKKDNAKKAGGRTMLRRNGTMLRRDGTMLRRQGQATDRTRLRRKRPMRRRQGAGQC